ncbi:hypothetical protein OK351_13595 [Glutamicibacter sp. MNS18]|nr:hypothetical protein [Glutamicibacter sp. MNS18]MCW4466527.1 hypothetical protein [Glutamicibacter sp. MNS18]
MGKHSKTADELLLNVVVGVAADDIDGDGNVEDNEGKAGDKRED